MKVGAAILAADVSDNSVCVQGEQGSPWLPRQDLLLLWAGPGRVCSLLAPDPGPHGSWHPELCQHGLCVPWGSSLLPWPLSPVRAVINSGLVQKFVKEVSKLRVGGVR